MSTINFFDRPPSPTTRKITETIEFGEPALHGTSVALDKAKTKYVLNPQPWQYGVSLPVKLAASPPVGAYFAARFTVRVSASAIMMGAYDRTTSTIAGEQKIRPQSMTQIVTIAVVEGMTDFLIRTADDMGEAPYVILEDVEQLLCSDENEILLVDVSNPSFRNILKPLLVSGTHHPGTGSTEADALAVKMLVTHSTRLHDLSRSSQSFTRTRYSGAERLASLAPFETLSPADQRSLYHGGLTLFNLDLTASSPRLEAVRSIDSVCAVQHAVVIDGALVLCAEAFLCVLPSLDSPINGAEYRPASPFRIDDPWFAGLHTVVPAGPGRCLVSASGPDAALLVDLKERRVVRRWRLPETKYGRNYPLTAEMSVHDHYIQNDYQLGHLNSAIPDGNGGCFVTTLGQGDIGHFSSSGAYEILARGHYTVHGLRFLRTGQALYFSESATGRLMQIDLHGNTKVLAQIESEWLHDTIQVAEHVFVFLVGDRNELTAIDLMSQREIARFSMADRGACPIFVSIIE